VCELAREWGLREEWSVLMVIPDTRMTLEPWGKTKVVEAQMNSKEIVVP